MEFERSSATRRPRMVLQDLSLLHGEPIYTYIYIYMHKNQAAGALYIILNYWMIMDVDDAACWIYSIHIQNNLKIEGGKVRTCG